MDTRPALLHNLPPHATAHGQLVVSGAFAAMQGQLAAKSALGPTMTVEALYDYMAEMERQAERMAEGARLVMGILTGDRPA